MDYTALGRRIKEERQKLNMTQERLAEEVNLSTSYIGQIERGERKLTLDSLINITNCLGVTVDYLLQDSISQEQSSYRDLWTNLSSGATPREKELGGNLTKLLLNYGRNHGNACAVYHLGRDY